MNAAPPNHVDGTRYVAVGKVPTQVTYLQMLEAPSVGRYPPALAGVDVRKAKPISVAFYRHLYDAVGSTWNWTARKLLTDEELLAILSQPTTAVYVLYVDNQPAGYVELDFALHPDHVEIVFFGLMPAYIGKGLGTYFLNWTVALAWLQYRTSRLWLHTCSLDSERALPTYLKAGFTKYDERSEWVDVIGQIER